MDLTTPGYKELRWEFNLVFDGFDSWGSTLAWWFGVAENLYHYDPSLVPASWQYRDAPSHADSGLDTDEYPDSEIADLMDRNVVTADDLLAFGAVLTRYANLLKMAGKDY